MARKAQRPAVQFVIYLIVRGFVCFVQALPLSLAYACASFLAAIAYRIDKRHRTIAADNIQHAFPAWSPQQVDSAVRRCFVHFAHVLIEMIVLPRKMTSDSFDHFLRLNEGVKVSRTLLSGRPVLLLTGHLGNWEMSGYSMGVVGYRLYAVARVLDNPYLERFLKKFRERTGQTIIAKKDDFERLQSALKSGGTVCLLADQDAGPRGVFVPFFHRPASAHKAIALMAMEYNAMVIVGASVRVGKGMKYESIAEDVFDAREYSSDPNAVTAIVARYHAGLQRLVEQYPEQYFWFHRRWKSQPMARKKPVAVVS